MKSALYALIVMVLAAGEALAAQAETAPVIQPPRIRLPDGGYSHCYQDAARRLGREGRLYVDLTVEPDGSVSNVRFPAGTEPWQQATARCILRQIEFTPGTNDGRPVAAEATVPMNFSLASAPGKSSEIEWPQLDSTPDEFEEAYRACYPEDSLAMQTARYKMTIGSDGRARNIKVVESGGDVGLDEAGVCVIRRLQFRPTLRSGRAIKSTITLPLRMRPAR